MIKNLFKKVKKTEELDIAYFLRLCKDKRRMEWTIEKEANVFVTSMLSFKIRDVDNKINLFIIEAKEHERKKREVNLDDIWKWRIQ